MNFTYFIRLLSLCLVAIVVASGESGSCGGKPADVLFLLDASGSIWGPDFDKQLKFVSDVVSQFDVRPAKTRVGVLTFGDHARYEMDLTRLRTKQALLSGIQSIRQSRGSTRTDSALLRAREIFSRHGRQGVPKLAIVMTDGESNSPDITEQEAKLLHDSQVTTFAIGIGQSVDEDEVRKLASREDYKFSVDTYDALASLKELLAIKACDVEIEEPVAIESPASPPSKGCGGKPADIVFALDASGSIWGPDFQKQIHFVQDIIGVFDISPETTRIGVLTFNEEPHRQFHLDKYGTEEQIKLALEKVEHLRGSTGTAKAIHSMSHHFFAPDHSREGVVKIGIVITDGRSDDPAATAHQVKLAHEQGIHLFAIGVGRDVDQEELAKIASSPADQYMFMVNNYNALDTIKELLAIEACKATAPPTTTPLPTTTEAPVKDIGCGTDVPADVVFAVPPTADAPETNHVIRFIKDVVQEFDVSDDTVRLGVAPKDCLSVPGFHLKDNVGSRENILLHLEGLTYAAADTTTIIKHFRTNSFTGKNGARKNAKKIGVIIIDQDSSNVRATIKQARKARGKNKIELFVVAVGKGVSEVEKHAIVGTAPDAQRYIIDVEDYASLANIKSTLVERINGACSGHV